MILLKEYNERRIKYDEPLYGSKKVFSVEQIGKILVNLKNGKAAGLVLAKVTQCLFKKVTRPIEHLALMISADYLQVQLYLNCLSTPF